MHFLAHDGLLDGGLKFRPLCFPDHWIDHDKPNVQVAKAGLDSAAIVGAVLTALGQAGARRTSARA